MSRTNNKLQIGIVGAGAIVRDRHLPGLQKHSESEIVAVSNSTYESAEKFCQENAPHAPPMANWADLLSLPDLDIVWIGTPPYMHSAVTISALEAGKHVFCQARMSMDLVEAEEMLAASKRYPELVTMLCPPPMGMRADLLVKKLLAEDYIGHPHHVRLQSFTSNYLDPAAPPHWRQAIGSKFTAPAARSPTISGLMWCKRGRLAIAGCTLSVFLRNWRPNGGWKKIF